MSGPSSLVIQSIFCILAQLPVTPVNIIGLRGCMAIHSLRPSCVHGKYLKKSGVEDSFDHSMLWGSECGLLWNICLTPASKSTRTPSRSQKMGGIYTVMLSSAVVGMVIR